MESPLIMAVDLGVTNVKAALVDRRGQMTHYDERPTRMEAGTSGVAEVLVETCREILGKAGLSTRELAGVGCAVPGCVSPDTGVIVASATPSWIGVDVKQPLEQSFGRTVSVEGDGCAAAIAAYTFGPTRGQDHLLGIHIGTGISCGYLPDGRLLRGAGQAAMEAGHMPLFHEGRSCSCGHRGCWEAHAGGGALRRLLVEYRQAGHEIPELPEELAELALEANDEVAVRIWQEQGTVLGLGVAVMLDILNPRTVVFSGGYSRSWSLFKKSLLKTARERALSRNAEAAIVCAPNPHRSALLGAAVTAVRLQGPADFFVDGSHAAS
ncbi:MAG: ROK family protein [Deltaproteobacteria bacterium]|nr:ROK family protein [Deltaproteobacteria bacterium]